MTTTRSTPAASVLSIAMAAMGAASAALTPACPAQEDDVLSPSEEACEHAAEGPAVAVTGSAAPDSTAGDVSAEHTRFDLTLQPLDGGAGGAGWFQLDSEGGEFVFFLTRDGTLALQDGNGASIGFEGDAAQEDTCPEVILSRTAPLPVGKVFIEVRTTTGLEVSLLVEHAGEHSHEGE